VSGREERVRRDKILRLGSMCPGGAFRVRKQVGKSAQGAKGPGHSREEKLNFWIPETWTLDGSFTKNYEEGETG